jgi:hypothetical protein
VILKTRQGRYRVKVKNHGVIVADRTFARWNDAEAWEADRKHQVAAGRLAPAAAGRTPLADVYATWSRVRPGQVQARTWQSDQSAWTSHLSERFGQEAVGAITGHDVQSFAADLHGDHCAGTVRRSSRPSSRCWTTPPTITTSRSTPHECDLPCAPTHRGVT